MDSSGRIYLHPTEKERELLSLIPVRRDLTEKEKAAQQISRYLPCGCGSGVKFKFCCYRKQFEPTEAKVPQKAY